MLLILAIWLLLVCYSVWTGAAGATGHRYRIIFYEFKPRGCSYTFGLSHRQYDGVSADGGRWLIDTLTIGVILAALEIDFYKKESQDI